MIAIFKVYNRATVSHFLRKEKGVRGFRIYLLFFNQKVVEPKLNLSPKSPRCYLLFRCVLTHDAVSTYGYFRVTHQSKELGDGASFSIQGSVIDLKALCNRRKY